MKQTIVAALLLVLAISPLPITPAHAAQASIPPASRPRPYTIYSFIYNATASLQSHGSGQATVYDSWCNQNTPEVHDYLLDMTLGGLLVHTDQFNINPNQCQSGPITFAGAALVTGHTFHYYFKNTNAGSPNYSSNTLSWVQ